MIKSMTGFGRSEYTDGKRNITMVENITENDVNIKLNTMIAKQYYENLLELRKEFSVEGDITLQFLAGLPDVMKAIPDVEDEEEITKAILIPVAEAAANLEKMRAVEGEKLAEDLIAKGRSIRSILDKIAERAPQVSIDYTARLRERITELIGGSIEVP